MYSIAGLALIFILHYVFSILSNKPWIDGNAYNSYMLQTEAWLSGNLYIENRAWLELAIFDEKYYVSFPPFPSYLLLILYPLFGTLGDSVLVLISLAVGFVFSMLICKNLDLSDFRAFLLGLFLYLGTNMWQITVDPWVWYLAQNLAFTFTMASIYFALKSRMGLAVFFLACGFGCRPLQIIFLPFIFYLCLINCNNGDNFIAKLKAQIKKWYVLLPALALGVSFMVLNYLRFENPFEFGHNYLPEFTRTQEGQFHISYLLKNLPNLFNFPRLDQLGNISDFMFNGINIFLVIPIFILYPIFLFVAIKNKQLSKTDLWINVIGVSSIILHIILTLTHRTMGGHHFGNRYIMDNVPFLFLLTAYLSNRIRSRICFILTTTPLFILGLIINCWGTLIYYQ